MRLLRHCEMPAKVVIIIRFLYEGSCAQVVHNGQRTQPLNMRTGVKTRLPTISPAVFGRPGLGDEDTLGQEERYSVDLYDILRRP